MRKRVSADVVFGLASRLADGGRVWIAWSGALASTGRFGRRAGTRGLLVLAAAQATCAALKLVIGRRRPRRRPAAVLARRPSPTTSSLPSSHAAAAAGFAAAAAMEVPSFAVPLVACAGVVSWSRVATGHHRRRDVAAGAGVGLALALVSRRVWPVAPHEPAVARTSASFDRGEEVAGGTVGIVVNLGAGPAFASDPATRLRDALPGARVVTVDDPDDLVGALEQAAAADVIGVSGGDGTTNRAAAVAHTAGKPLLVVPGGTLNHFAHAIGVASVDDAVAAMTKGRVVGVDLARVADRVFLNVASVGVYTDLIAARERMEDRIGKWPALVLALVRVLRRARPLDLELDGRHRRVWMVFAGNCRYHPAGFAPSWRERLDDGHLDVRVVDASSPWSRTRLLLAVLSGRLGRSSVYEEWVTQRLEVRAPGWAPVRVAVDGEVFDAPAEFAITKDHRPLTVLVPPPD